MRYPIPFALLALLAACDAPPKPPAAEPKLPQQLCEQVDKGLAQIAKGGGLDFDDKGEASMMEAAWVQLSSNQREQLVKLLAYHASCAAGAQSDGQSVVIRGDEGHELVRRSVSTRVDMAGALNGLGEDVAR
ncbi:MAG: hypothetical protein ACJ8EB_08820 [Allosphingosinicella sp.]